MTIKQLLGHFSIGHNQVVHITDETKHITYESDAGTLCLKGYEDLFDYDYEKALAYIKGMHVRYFSANDNMIWIHAEAKPLKVKGGC